MARYSHKGHDTIRYNTKYRDTIRYNTIRKCFTVCKNRKQARNSAAAHHWSTVILPINTVAAAGAWILTVRRGDGRERPARRWSAGGRCSLKSRVIQQGYCEYWLPNNSSCGDSTAAIVWRPHGQRAVARLKYLAIAQSLNI